MSSSEITIDFLMIIGKYFRSSEDFINAMKICKKYYDLAGMYKFNPISDTTLFENIETQYFYRNDDFDAVIPGLFKYVICTLYTSKDIRKIRAANRGVKKFKGDDNNGKKSIDERIDTKLVLTDDQSKVLINTPYRVGYDIRYGAPTLYYIQDTKGNSMSFIIHYDIDKYPTCRIIYRNRNNEYYYVGPENRELTAMDTTSLFYLENSRHQYIVANMERGNVRRFRITSNMDKEFLSGKFFFDEGSLSKEGKHTVLLRDPFFAEETLRDRTAEDPAFHEHYYTKLLGRHLNVFIDSDVTVQDTKHQYNFGYARYIYIDREGNHMIFNVLPSEIIITVRVKDSIRVFKPKYDMTEIVNGYSMKTNYIWSRMTVDKFVLDQFYTVPLREMIKPLSVFTPYRLLIATNDYTRYSLVYKQRYVVKMCKKELLNLV